MTNHLTFFRIIQAKDDYRVQNIYKDGGFALDDEETLQKFRNAFKDLIK